MNVSFVKALDHYWFQIIIQLILKAKLLSSCYNPFLEDFLKILIIYLFDRNLLLYP